MSPKFEIPYNEKSRSLLFTCRFGYYWARKTI